MGGCTQAAERPQEGSRGMRAGRQHLLPRALNPQELRRLRVARPFDRRDVRELVVNKIALSFGVPEYRFRPILECR
jgi:hypothetical protein